MRKIIFSLCLIFAFFVSLKDVYAVARFSACAQSSANSSSSGTGLDGSNCDAGLVCDQTLLLCSYTTESVCMGTGIGSGGCGIGQKCMTDAGSIAAAGTVGSCQTAAGGSAENNAIGDILCNTYKIATGKVGRGVIVVVLFVTGITFYLGKVQWGTIVAIVIGAGLCFGGPAVVSVMVGKNFLC